MNSNPPKNQVTGNFEGTFIQDLPTDNNVSYADLMRSSGTLQNPNKVASNQNVAGPTTQAEHHRKLSESPPRSINFHLTHANSNAATNQNIGYQNGRAVNQSLQYGVRKMHKTPTENTYVNIYGNAQNFNQNQIQKQLKRPTTSTRQSLGKQRLRQSQKMSTVKSNKGNIRHPTGAESVVTGTTAAGGQSTNLIQSQNQLSNFNVPQHVSTGINNIARHASLTTMRGKVVSTNYLRADVAASQTATMVKGKQQAVPHNQQPVRQRPAFSAHPTRGNIMPRHMDGTSSSILTNQVGGKYALVGQRAGGSQSQSKVRDIDFTKVNFQKLTNDPTESQPVERFE